MRLWNRTTLWNNIITATPPNCRDTRSSQLVVNIIICDQNNHFNSRNFPTWFFRADVDRISFTSWEKLLQIRDGKPTWEMLPGVVEHHTFIPLWMNLMSTPGKDMHSSKPSFPYQHQEVQPQLARFLGRIKNLIWIIWMKGGRWRQQQSWVEEGTDISFSKIPTGKS